MSRVVLVVFKKHNWDNVFFITKECEKDEKDENNYFELISG